MSQQILIIHGGTSFDTYEDYLSHLKKKEIDLEKLRPRIDWKDSIGDSLGKDFDIFSPKMPNGTNARYEEWKLWFERIVSLLNENVVLVGHSLGGIFLAKYLSENQLTKTIRATILVAAPFDNANSSSEESLDDFALPNSLENLDKQGGKIYLIQSEDDPAVPVDQVYKYQQALPKAEIILFKDRGHFKQETFPELVELIQSI